MQEMLGEGEEMRLLRDHVEAELELGCCLFSRMGFLVTLHPCRPTT